ncbi:carbonic anhydrase 9 isoform X2 [Alligator mississippiensis]|uniref:carbonic anhydrase 9 isoform X2 n=1 Tax=Alligator mississippiensis TaxID=8496 RepID=UPI0028781528|nr:carbonic anhydrase 9 isoform X2 [Alligator mississippiensis]
MGCSRPGLGLGLGLALALALLLRTAPARAEDKSEPEDGPHHGTGAAHGHWSYADKLSWSQGFPDCSGQKQSPINIITEATLFSPQLQPIHLSGYNLPPSEQLTLKNNGHTVVLRLPATLTMSGSNGQQYQAVQLHLHWGSPAGPGSEHTVDGQRYQAEIHVVHYNTRYDSIFQAMTQPDGLAVLAALLQAGPEKNPSYEHVLEHLEEVSEEGDDTLVAGFNIAGLLPADLSRYFRYNGSLTTPPCYQTVMWTVFNQTVRLSLDQILKLEETLYGDHDKLLENNFRLPQAMHGRRVLASFSVARGPEVPSVPAGGGSPVPPTSDNATGAGTSGAPQPDDGEAAMTPVPDGHAGAAAGRGLGPGPETHLGSSFQAGDVLAVLFGVLFAVTALAFLVYVHKQRSHSRRLDSPDKPKVIYTAATTEENAV